MTVGEKIKEARKKKGYSQKELAEKLNCGYQNISQWETGKRKPKYENLVKIANALDCNIKDLIPHPPAKGVYIFKKDSQAWEKLPSYRDFLKPSYYEEISDMIKQMNETGRKKVYEYCVDLYENPKYYDGLIGPPDQDPDQEE